MSRYSQLYLERGKPTADSARFRNRLAAILTREPYVDVAGEIVTTIREKIGCELPAAPMYYQQLDRFLKAADLRDLLDAITVVGRMLHVGGMPKAAAEWGALVSDIFYEENLAYRMGDDGIVHPFVDSEFEANRAATIAALAELRFSAVLNEVEAAFRHLRHGENKQAIRMMFPAVETAAKVLFPGTMAKFDVGEVRGHLQPALSARYAGNQPAIDASMRLLEGFEKWIVASHQYRHGQEVQEPADPPQEVAVAHLSLGATYLRWMIELAG